MSELIFAEDPKGSVSEYSIDVSIADWWCARLVSLGYTVLDRMSYNRRIHA